MSEQDGTEHVLVVTPWRLVTLWAAGTAVFLLAFPFVQDLGSAALGDGDTRLLDPGEHAARLLVWAVVGLGVPAWLVGRR